MDGCSRYVVKEAPACCCYPLPGCVACVLFPCRIGGHVASVLVRVIFFFFWRFNELLGFKKKTLEIHCEQEALHNSNSHVVCTRARASIQAGSILFCFQEQRCTLLLYTREILRGAVRRVFCRDIGHALYYYCCCKCSTLTRNIRTASIKC